MSANQTANTGSRDRKDTATVNTEAKKVPGRVLNRLRGSHPVKKMRKNRRQTNHKMDTTKPFRLMDLPIELRLLIYKELLVQPGGVRIKAIGNGTEMLTRPSRTMACPLHSLSTRRCPSCFSIHPNILATCKIIRSEAQDELWTQKFLFDDPESLHIFLLPLTPASIGCLRNIVISRGLVSYGGRNFLFFAPLQNAVNLRNLQLEGPITTGKSFFKSDEKAADHLATIFFRNMFPFVRAVAARRGVDAVLEIVKFHRGDMHCPESQEGRPWSNDREEAFFRLVRVCLVQMVGHENARVKMLA